MKTSDGRTKFRAEEDAELANKLRGLKQDEAQIYHLVMDSKDQGIATKDRQRKTNLPAANVKGTCTRLADKGINIWTWSWVLYEYTSLFAISHTHNQTTLRGVLAGGHLISVRGASL